MNKLLVSLKEYGADIDGAMNRFLDDEELYISCFSAFLEDEAFDNLAKNIASEDYINAFNDAHTLKGISGNMGLTPIYDVICNMVQSLRQNEHSDLGKLYAKIVYHQNMLKKIQLHDGR